MSDRILAVDDEPANRYLLENLLSDFQITTVRDGAEMWERIDEVDPSIILLDVMLPGTDGFRLALELSRHERYHDVPVIFLTARTDPADVVAGFELGGYDYIKKPFDDTELLARIRSALKKSGEQERLSREAVRDALTGLFNRRYLEHFIQRESGRMRRNLARFSVAMIDIDFFKSLNDNRGHQCGDYVLRELAGIIMSSLRIYDIPIRYGGEEFLIIFPSIGRHDASRIMERIRSGNASHGYVFDGSTFSFSVTCGIADSDDIDPSNPSMEDLIRIADGRLYRGKESGRDRIVADDDGAAVVP